MQDSLLRSLLKGVVWRVFSTALTVSIILAVFRDTVQVSTKLAGLLGSAAAARSCRMSSKQPILCWLSLATPCCALLFAKFGVLLVLQVLQDDATHNCGPQPSARVW